MWIWTPIWNQIPEEKLEESVKKMEAFFREGIEDIELLKKVPKLIKKWDLEEARKLIFNLELKVWKVKTMREVTQAKIKFTQSLEKITWTNPFHEVYHH